MAININPGSPLRHVGTYNSSGNFIAPIGTSVAFVSIHGSTGGGSGGTGTLSGATGGAGIVSGAFVQVVPGASHVVTIGAGGAGGAPSNIPVLPQAGATGGSTVFDGAITVTGSAGGNAIGARYSPGNTGAQGTASGYTNLTSLSPSANTLVRTGTISTQNTGGSSGGAGGNQGPARYNAGSVGFSGAAGQVHIYI
jgi:hypothetical protein